MSSLLEVAERCEKATEGDRDLDIDILRALSGKHWLWHPGAGKIVVTWPQYGCGAPGNPICSLEEFTTSIDDAMTLIPEGMALRKEWLPAGSWPARCYIHKDQSMPLHDADFSFRSLGETEALAVCAAALRARHSLAVVGGESK